MACEVGGHDSGAAAEGEHGNAAFWDCGVVAFHGQGPAEVHHLFEVLGLDDPNLG